LLRKDPTRILGYRLSFNNSPRLTRLTSVRRMACCLSARDSSQLRRRLSSLPERRRAGSARHLGLYLVLGGSVAQSKVRMVLSPSIRSELDGGQLMEIRFDVLNESPLTAPDSQGLVT